MQSTFVVFIVTTLITGTVQAGAIQSRLHAENGRLLQAAREGTLVRTLWDNGK